MLIGSKRIVLSNDTVNRFGFWVATAGIDLSQYEKNPIMLFMHKEVDRDNLPIGHMTGLRIEADGSLTGVPAFDDEDDFAVKLYKKYEKGIIKMASVGLIPKEWSTDAKDLRDGQTLPTLMKSILDEISLCDRGANNDALQLKDAYGERINLSNGHYPHIPKIKKNDNMKTIELKNPDGLLALLVLTADADESAINAAVKKLSEDNVSLTASAGKLQAALDEKTKELEKVELSAKQAKIEALVQGAVDARKITADEKDEYVSLAGSNYESVEKLLAKKVGTPTAESVFKGNQSQTDRLTELVKLSFHELHKTGKLEELKALDIDAFNEKVKEA